MDGYVLLLCLTIFSPNSSLVWLSVQFKRIISLTTGLTLVDRESVSELEDDKSTL